MKTYHNGATGPNLEQCDIITFDFKDATLQFCLPEAPQGSRCILASQDSIDNWQTITKLKLLVDTKWKYSAKDEAGEWNIASVRMDMKLINLELDEFESWLGTERYCLLRKNELSRIAIEYFVKSAEDRARKFNPDISLEEALKLYSLFTRAEDLLISKQDVLPWFTNKLARVDGTGSSLIQTIIPISERAVILFLFEISELTSGERPFYFTEEECQEFGDMLRNEFLSYVKITYSPEIQEKIKQYAQNT